ncbi:MAG TPA: YifB family Mg chelatase-like AAA ATPase [Actinomycetaceae bacterium]|nr:YifB family Mg chelatase-like AAA ATPase [Actinomycetaceae bacterium]
MTLGRSLAIALLGLRGHPVAVEAHCAQGLPTFSLIGLPDTSLSEARERVRAAVASCGITWPARRITVNLSPASLPKSGSSFDVAIAAATLAAAGVVDPTRALDTVHVGELGLDGSLHPVRGVLPAVAAAVEHGYTEIVVPLQSVPEAELVPGARVIGAAHLGDIIRRHGGQARTTPPLAPAVNAVEQPSEQQPAPDLVDVLGQDDAKLALEVAAAGSHHLFLLGPPGAGKTLLAQRLPGLLPDLSDDEAIAVTALHSLSGTFDARDGLLRRPPFEAPHHTATAAAVVGGGSGLPRPGAASRAHRGVLFLDEAPEFSGRVLDTLRQPLESGELTLHRARGSARYPARFQLAMAANPCPCGQGSGKGLACTCTPLARRRYLARLSGPLLDRIDIQMEVPALTRADLAMARQPEPSAAVAKRVARARRAQRRRLRGTPWRSNAEVSGVWLRDSARLAPSAVSKLEGALDSGRLSLRGLDRVLRIAWTLADLAGLDRPGREQTDLALALRMPGIRGG